MIENKTKSFLKVNSTDEWILIHRAKTKSSINRAAENIYSNMFGIFLNI